MGNRRGWCILCEELGKETHFLLFLFPLCTKGLHGLINSATRRGDIKGFSLRKGGPDLTHLLFADDSLLFCRATLEECEKVLQILESYEQASSQKVNRNKATIFFTKATPDTLKQAIKIALGL